MKYDYLIVGCGLFGATAARLLRDAGKRVLIIERKYHVAGSAYTTKLNGVEAHYYGAHIFHTNNEAAWAFVNNYAEFNNYRHKVKALGEDRILYSMPFNMNTFHTLWGCITPAEARQCIDSSRVRVDKVVSMRDWALSNLGTEIYERLIHGYTIKQWGRDPADLPASIIKRLPIRMTYNDDYFSDRYQGIPINGYTEMVENMIAGIDIILGRDLIDIDWRGIARKLVFSGSIDQLFSYKLGGLQYRSVRLHHIEVTGDHQGTAVINYPNPRCMYTRSIEHHHFYGDSAGGILTHEYPDANGEPYYPINDIENDALYKRYLDLIDDDIIGGGRLFRYRYLNMDQVIVDAMNIVARELK